MQKNMQKIAHQIFAENILLATGWANNVLMDIDCNGLIQQIKADHELVANFNGILLNGPVIPGMVNNHSHAFQWAMAGLAEQSGTGNDSFWSWRKLMYDFVGKITPDDLHAIASALYMQMLKAGYTSVGEFHYLHHSQGGQHYKDIAEMSAQISNAATTAGIGLTLLPVFYRYAGFGQQAPSQGQARFINDPASYQRLLERINSIVKEQPQQNFGIAPHSLRAVEQSDIKRAIEALDALNNQNHKAPVHIHIAEQLKEVEDCTNHYGQRPVEWLANQFELNQRWCLVHATHINQTEIKAVADSQAVVSICTTTEGNLGDGFFPMMDYKKANGRWSIGSDSHISLDPAEELRWLEYQNRLTHHSRTMLTAGDNSSNGHWLWSQAATGGAQSLNIAAGKIAVGMRADFVELDSSCLNLLAKTDHQIIDAFIFNRQNEQMIRSVWVAGNCQIAEHQHSQEAEIKARYQQTINKLMQGL